MIQNLSAGVLLLNVTWSRLNTRALAKGKALKNGDKYELQLWSLTNWKMCWLAQAG